MSQKQQGFTLIEILMVIIIFAIIISFAVLTFGDFGKSRQVRTTAEEFQRVVQYFREQAVLGSANYTIKISTTGYQVSQPHIMPNQSTDVPYQLSKTHFPSNVTVSPISVIEMYSTGNITAFNLFFGSTAKPKMFRVIGQTNGKIMIETYEK